MIKGAYSIPKPRFCSMKWGGLLSITLFWGVLLHNYCTYWGGDDWGKFRWINRCHSKLRTPDHLLFPPFLVFDSPTP